MARSADALADPDHPAGALVAEHHREAVPQPALGQGQVGVADPGRGQPHPDLARARASTTLDVGDGGLTVHFVQHRRLHDRATGSCSDLIWQNSA